MQMAQTIGWPVDRSIEEAAMDLGCTPLKTFFVITLSLDDLVIASFVSGPGATTLPMVVFSSVRMGVSPKINALAALIILAVSLIAFIAWYLMWRALPLSQFPCLPKGLPCGPMASWKLMASCTESPTVTGPSTCSKFTSRNPAISSCCDTTSVLAMENGPGPQERASSPGSGRKRRTTSCAIQ